ncbi:hypothetical protein [Terrabacter carboxydivorans]|uniref:Uncharacterized protein n=1 Tax=Terrabacter carboxydivorans TaxID=619730 RepID=A0ABN3L3I6_9MICO
MSQKHDLDAPDPDGAPEGRHTAGAFDIRNFIGALLGLYGVILLAMGLFGDQALAKTGGVNANLYAGIALIVVSAFFVVWARVKPIVVPEHVERPDDDPVRPAPKRRPGGH